MIAARAGPVRIALQQLARFLIGPGLGNLRRFAKLGCDRHCCPFVPPGPCRADGGLFALSFAARNPCRHLDRPCRRPGRGGRARRGDRARGRNADDHAQRAAGRQPARLSRPERPRPARTVRLRPSRPLRRADAQGDRRTRSASRRRRRRRSRRLPARRRGGPARHAAKRTGPSARARGPSAQSLDRLRWPWAARGRAARSPGPSATSAGCSRRLPEWEEKRRRAQPQPVRLGAASGGRPARGTGRPRRRSARRASATMPRRRRRASTRARCEDAAQSAARRGRDRDRQDAGLSRPGLAVGGRGGRHGLGLDLSPRRCSASSTARARGSSPTRPSAGARIVIRKGRENYLCLLNLEDALQGGFAGRAAILAQLVARWAAWSQGRRHGRRRPARLAHQPVPPRRRDRADRPARRMRLCRLPALPALLHRAGGAGERRTPTWSSPTMPW